MPYNMKKLLIDLLYKQMACILMTRHQEITLDTVTPEMLKLKELNTIIIKIIQLTIPRIIIQCVAEHRTLKAYTTTNSSLE